ncbi:hypothetical protein SPHINGO391_470232 [Sphingomonas aurantiaca]|uniref:Uncharacterized protein n=1 Tax=Sphingomonas aurantiaca TaxID=185949 RepID=A0A5E7ZR00_9SPHN|nr:hypothetical protein SPHINGO391_470232 [Sphingomonas aurantiaca]
MGHRPDARLVHGALHQEREGSRRQAARQHLLRRCPADAGTGLAREPAGADDRREQRLQPGSACLLQLHGPELRSDDLRRAGPVRLYPPVLGALIQRGGGRPVAGGPPPPFVILTKVRTHSYNGYRALLSILIVIRTTKLLSFRRAS